MSTFLLEIGSEELPSRFLAGERLFLKKAAEDALNEAHLSYGDISVYSTPRRCTLSIHDIAAMQETRVEIVSGPPKRIAYDGEGRPSKALEGFLRTQNVRLEDLQENETEKGVYICARKTIGGRKASDILAELAPKLILSIPFAKRMRWGSTKIAYARPLHWILALLDADIVPFAIEDLQSGRMTYGHRIHGTGPFSVESADDYWRVVEENCGVVLSHEARSSLIVQKGDEMAKEVNGRVLWNDRLLEEVVGLVEHPVPLLGSFDKRYLEVPREVLTTSMESHQKSFGLEDEHGALLPYFLTVSNLDPLDLSVVRKGWERVLHARLEDARFFWKEDLHSNFETWLEKLDHVIFIGPLGTMGEKTRRLEKLCLWIARQLGCRDVREEDCLRAGRLSKADLVSSMVGEFDTLQGIMGGIYAERMGENTNVAKALKEQYLPAGPESPLPETLLGAILSIADKADTLAGCFGLNKIPSGTADPNGLRRCALGIIRISQSFGFALDMRAFFSEAQSLYGERKWKLSQADALTKLMEFFEARLQHHLEASGYNVVAVDACLRAGMTDVCDVWKRLEAFSTFQKREDYVENVQVMKRINNIVQKEKGSVCDYRTSLFEDPSEKALAEVLEKTVSQLKGADYTRILESVATLRPAVNAFFDSVMVLCEDTSVRQNRVALLLAIQNIYKNLVDFSALQI